MIPLSDAPHSIGVPPLAGTRQKPRLSVYRMVPSAPQATRVP